MGKPKVSRCLNYVISMLKLRWSSGSFRGVINKRGGQKQIHPYLFYWINRNSYTNKSLRIVFPAHSLSMQSWLSWMLHLMENGYSFVFVGDFWNWSPKFLRQPLTNIVNTLGFKSLRLEAKLPSLTAFIYSWTDLLFSSEGGFQCQTHCSHCLAYAVLCKLWLKEGELMVVACVVAFESMFSYLNLIKDSTDFRSSWKYTYSCKRDTEDQNQQHREGGETKIQNPFIQAELMHEGAVNESK